MHNITKSLLIGSAAWLMGASGAFAMDDATVLAELKAMREQMGAMQRKINGLEEELADAKSKAASAEKVAKKVESKSAPSADTAKVTLGSNGNGLKIESPDGEYSLKINGFAQVDAAAFDDDRLDQPDGTTLRRARLSASGNLTKNFKYKLENDFANNASALTDVYLEYAGLDPVSIMVGQFKEPFSLETLTSDLFTSFIERASPTAFSPDRKIGAMISTRGDSPIGNYTVWLGGFGAGTGTASTDDESKDLTGRITLAPIAEARRVIHLGAAGSYRATDKAGNDIYRISSKPENNISSANAVDTGASGVSFVDHATLLGLEAAGVYGPVSIQGEYMQADLTRETGLQDVTYNGYYVEASYFLTGESRNYSASQAKFERTKPMWSLDPANGHWGAFQIMARMSNLDLNDSALNGGEMTNYTAGIKWYPNANTAVMFNYIKVDTDSRATTANDDPNIFLLRTQFDF